MSNSFAEQKIKDAARKVFQAKGYDAARTRDIAEEAGVNLALINYYYRSKESLFEEIMGDSILSFRNAIIGITNDSNTSVREKIETLTNNYFSIFMQEPDLPMFMFLETQ
ncbi:MAG: TetR/AcrR family transcriptional regulator, partial [Bacteroidales bacterium]|nr:TetR/AcrR family transcriptional regulator [Bacteroidales bacterium]